MEEELGTTLHKRKQVDLNNQKKTVKGSKHDCLWGVEIGLSNCPRCEVRFFSLTIKVLLNLSPLSLAYLISEFPPKSCILCSSQALFILWSSTFLKNIICQA